MTQRNSIYDPRFMQVLADLLALTVSFLAYQAVRKVMLPTSTHTFSISDIVVVATVVALAWMIVFWLGGLYRDYYIRSPFEEAFVVLKVTFVVSLLFYLVIYVDSPQDYQKSPRFVFVMYWLFVSGFVTIGRMVARAIQSYLRSKGTIQLRTLLVGSGKRVLQLLADIRNERAWGYNVVGVISTDNVEVAGIPILGSLAELGKVLEQSNVQEMLITMDHTDHNELLSVVAKGADVGCSVKIVPDMYEIVSGQARTQQMYGAPLIHVNPELMKPWEEAAKRILDIVISLLVLLIGLPVWITIGLIVALTSRGPVFYKQNRVGRNGLVFVMSKFRSMYVDENRAQTWTEKNDPRVTPFGRFIRKTHLDEIPQLWNVLRGEMSLVGPRPEQPHFVEKFSTLLPYYRRRHKVRPGITGWWQVKAKSNSESVEEIESRLRYDFFYIENISFMLDIEILVRTVFVMFTGHGRA